MFGLCFTQKGHRRWIAQVIHWISRAIKNLSELGRGKSDAGRYGVAGREELHGSLVALFAIFDIHGPDVGSLVLAATNDILGIVAKGSADLTAVVDVALELYL